MRATHRARTLLIAAAIAAGACTLTACREDATDAGSGGSATAASAEGTSAGQGNSADDDSAADDSAADEDAAGDDAPAGVDKGVNGAFAGGTVEYLAPEKYIVSVDGKEQQFYVSSGTGVYGAGTLCGEYSTRATTRCSLKDLRDAAKSGSVAADVVVKGGVATRITERPAPDEGPAVDDQ
ncbi:hypothetical protein [Streptomyces alfalfae]|uniref:Lipoprotein n=1 Tax=Streptomyces alfalfae TaxID=1642299 RepID=A0A7T4U171_9ACTN|nr:hypothetical protein [Streptomyces alfalfae]QQC92583.1 hypothetical protein I8755_32525 [Streptomyces alfalfae]